MAIIHTEPHFASLFSIGLATLHFHCMIIQLTFFFLCSSQQHHHTLLGLPSLLKTSCNNSSQAAQLPGDFHYFRTVPFCRCHAATGLCSQAALSFFLKIVRFVVKIPHGIDSYCQPLEVFLLQSVLQSANGVPWLSPKCPCHVTPCLIFHCFIL